MTLPQPSLDRHQPVVIAGKKLPSMPFRGKKALSEVQKRTSRLTRRELDGTDHRDPCSISSAQRILYKANANMRAQMCTFAHALMPAGAGTYVCEAVHAVCICNIIQCIYYIACICTSTFNNQMEHSQWWGLMLLEGRGSDKLRAPSGAYLLSGWCTQSNSECGSEANWQSHWGWGHDSLKARITECQG